MVSKAKSSFLSNEKAKKKFSFVNFYTPIDIYRVLGNIFQMFYVIFVAKIMFCWLFDVVSMWAKIQSPVSIILVCYCKRYRFCRSVWVRLLQKQQNLHLSLKVAKRSWLLLKPMKTY